MSTATLHIEMEKILMPKLRFQGFEGEWEKKKLGDVGKIRMCKRVFSEETSETGEIPFYKIGTFGKEADAYITNELYFNYRERFSFPKIGEILMSASGTLGRTVVYDGKPAYFQDSNIVWIDNNEKLITNSFLYYIYQIVKYDSEGGTIQRLYNSIISNTKFNRPTLPEQQKIASFLSAVDEKIQQLSRKKELLSQYKKGVMQQLFSGKLRFKDENGKDYADWEEKKLGELCEIKGRIGYRGYTVQDIVEKGKGVITLSPSNMKKGKLNYNNSTYISWYKYEESPEIKVELNDVLLVKTASVGKSAFVDHLPEPATINPQVVILKRTSLYPKYLGYIVYHSTIQKQIIEAVGAGAVPNLSQASISNFIVPCPSKEEQQKIADFLSSIDVKIESTNQQINQTQSFKKGLMQQMFC
jgi:type I restriction enzyme S subunit